MAEAPLLIPYYRRTNSYALNVLLGALEAASLHRSVEVRPHSSLTSLGEDLQRAAETARPALVLWSFYSPSFSDCRRELSALRNTIDSPNITHLAGGVHATAEPEQTLRAGFDLVAIGEGEVTITDLVIRLSGGLNLRGLRGTAHLEAGRFVSHGPGSRIELDDYPPFAPEHNRFNPIEITRGCVYACQFCQTPFMFKARFRHRSVGNVINYVQIMKARGLVDIRFISPTSLSYGSHDESTNVEAIEHLLSSVREVVGTRGRIFFGSFPSEIRPEHVSPEALAMLKKYVNNDNIIIGGQSGSQKVLDLSRRGHNVDVIVSAVRYALEAGFKPNVDFIFGLPGEGPSDLEASLQLADKLADMGARIHGHTFMPLPGTPFKKAPAGKISGVGTKRIARLVSRGKLYGQWAQQIDTAQELADLRNSSKAPKGARR